MIAFSTAEIASRLQGTHLGEPVVFSTVSTDTRTLGAGDLFVALKGPNFDGHKFLESAQSAGAAAAMVSQRCETPMPQVLVEDTRVGLGQLAALWRETSAVPLVGITGSNGKTTVKEMVAAILSQRGEVLSTTGNLNNDIGLPLTLLRLQEQQFAVVEMGANHAGEIDYLSRIARPDVVVLNNAGRAHLEGFGSLEGVARAKAEIINGLSAYGCFVFNADDRWAPMWRELAEGKRMVGFGVGADADVRSPAESWSISWSEQGFVTRFDVLTRLGEVTIDLSLAGQHNRMNALAAVAASIELGSDLESVRQGLASLPPVKGRLQPRQADGVMVIDDTYNANPDSVGAAIDVLATAPGRRFLVLGQLAELGDEVDLFYSEIGQRANEAGIESLYACGDAAQAARSFGVGGFAAASRDELVEQLRAQLKPGDHVLVKGSRSAAMERVVDALTDRGTD
jgi:UDP-N-acetylmuramoyl-tripeptide--D-alanyl-D-alanine ligase